MSNGNMLEIDSLRVRYGRREVLKGVSFNVRRNEVLGVIGPAQSGKTTLLRCINRTIDNVPDAVVTGCIKVDGEDVRRVKDLPALRRKIGMVAPLPVGLPLSVFDNSGICSAHGRAFGTAGTWTRGSSNVCGRQPSGTRSRIASIASARVCRAASSSEALTIARAPLSHDPEILCLDEFSIAIDPVTTMRIEDVLKQLRATITILLVTNLVQQARRLANRTAFFLNGELVEIGTTEVIFSEQPSDSRTFDYVRGIFG